MRNYVSQDQELNNELPVTDGGAFTSEPKGSKDDSEPTFRPLFEQYE